MLEAAANNCHPWRYPTDHGRLSNDNAGAADRCLAGDGTSAAVTEAARLMCDRGVASVPVADGERLVGILTQHDLVRGIAEGLDPTTTSVGRYEGGRRFTSAVGSAGAPDAPRGTLVRGSPAGAGHVAPGRGVGASGAQLQRPDGLLSEAGIHTLPVQLFAVPDVPVPDELSSAS